ncbi:MAG TPA: GNAT family N-acetyltransferase [Kofleriaceae bacterium]|nr:GNAT family N-acetyltransferase [Kofleriaceae bacterium]
MLRAARPEDYDACVLLHGELGVPDPVPERATWIESAMPRITVATRDGDAVVGYMSWRSYGPLAHVMHLAVDPAARGKRIGEQLLVHARDAAKAAGCTRWYLNVKRDNAPALKLYDRVGLRLELESFALALPWSIVPRVSVKQRLVDGTDTDDDAIAKLFNVPADRVASFRSRGSFRLVTLRDDDDGLLGFAAFSPSFPGAATFCAREASLAVPMLEAVRHYADPKFDYVRVTIEGHRALADAVIALGAELMFEILRLSADIP